MERSMAHPDLTRLLGGWRSRDPDAAEALLAAAYQDLRRLARSHLRGERADHTLNATALVHEFWLRFARQRDQRFENRAHFFGAASRAMRRLLVDHARGRSARKRRSERVTLSAVDDALSTAPALHDILAVEAALEALSLVNERLVRIVECRVFLGLTIVETADALGISHTTVSDDWRFARAWLHRRLSVGPTGPGDFSRPLAMSS